MSRPQATVCLFTLSNLRISFNSATAVIICLLFAGRLLTGDYDLFLGGFYKAEKSNSCSIERAIDEPNNETYCIMLDGEKVGGVILKIENKTQHNRLELLFVSPEAHSRGIGYSAWQAVEALHPETKILVTCTPYFDKRNIHFYVNKCGFHIVEFYNVFHVDSNCPREDRCDENPMKCSVL